MDILYVMDILQYDRAEVPGGCYQSYIVNIAGKDAATQKQRERQKERETNRDTE